MRSATALLILGFAIAGPVSGCGDDATVASATTGAGASGGVAGSAGHPGGAAIGGGGSGGAGGEGGDAPGGEGPGGRGQGGESPGPAHVRVVAANLTSGNGQSYDPGHGLRILQGLAADVILIQEFNAGNDSPAAIGAFVDELCNRECSYVRGPAAEIPNGVISRRNILDSGSVVDPLVSNRTFVWARIDVPGPADLWAISVHLLSTSATDRNQEAVALMAFITTTIPAGDPVVVGGDFNTSTRTEAALTTLDPVFAVGAPYPVDQAGNDLTNQPRTEPYDWVLADDDLEPLEVSVMLGQSVFANGAVIDTRVYLPLSEISPALQGDSGAIGMQHMAVVRDFLFP